MKALSQFALALGLLALMTVPADAQERRSRRLARGSSHGHGRPAYNARRVWVPAHYENRFDRVWIPGCERREWVPARYGWRYLPCGQRQRYLIEAGHFHVVREPGRWERRCRRVWIAGHYDYR